MAFLSVIAVAGLALQAAGTFMAASAQKKAAAASAESLRLQAQEIEERRKLANLEARRRQREIIRQSIIARSEALSNITGSGVSLSGSALPGAEATISGVTGINLTNTRIASEIGNRIFDLSAASLQARARAAEAGGDIALGGALSSLGGMFVSNLGTIQRIGGNMFKF